MLITLIIILLLIGAAVVGSIYSNFLVFYSNFGESENYHRAYYASISALERGELVIKQRAPGYEGSGGFILGTGAGRGGNDSSDRNLSGLSYLSDYKDESTIFREIKSRTTRIPTAGKGDVEEMLATGDSSNYNMMNYENAEVFLLYNDSSTGNPYSGGEIGTLNVESISGEIRLPTLLSDKFGPLNTGKSLIGVSNTLPADDAIVDRQVKGQYKSGLETFPFTIYSTPGLKIGGGSPTVDYNKDSVFRESDINKILKFKFQNGYASPLAAHGDRGKYTNPTIISQAETALQHVFDIRNRTNNSAYKYIFKNTQNPQLRLSLLNLVEGFDGVTGHIYPFLEYYADFGGKEVPDKYFTINAEGAFKDYQVNTIVQKPTIKESILGNFTSIF